MKNIKYNKNFFKPGDTHILYDNIKEGEACNLYLVSTPTQLLSAIEAQNHFQTKNNVLVILFFIIGQGEKIKDMFRLSEYFPYNRLITYQNSNKINFIYFKKYLDTISDVSYKHIFMGDTSILYRRMIVNLEYENLYHIDNGIHAIMEQKSISNDSIEKPTLYQRFRYRHLKRKIFEIFYRFNGYAVDASIDDLSFFTLLKLKTFKNENIISHNYKYVRSLFGEDIGLYKKVFLDNYNLSIAGHREVLNVKIASGLPLNEREMVSSSGILLEIYPDTIKMINGYKNLLRKDIELKEKEFLSNKSIDDNELLKQLQYAYIFKDHIVFSATLNTLTDRIYDFLQIEDDISNRRLIELLSIWSESIKLINKPIKVNRFYELYDFLRDHLIEFFSTTNEKREITSYLVKIYINYYRYIDNSREIEIHNEYFYQNHKMFELSSINVLNGLLENKSYTDIKIKEFGLKILESEITNLLYKKSNSRVYALVTLANLLDKNMNEVTNHIINQNFNIDNMEKYLNILETLLTQTDDYERLIDRVWDIYAEKKYGRTNRIFAGLIVVKSYYSYGKVSEAIELYFQIWNQFGCKNRDEALKYLNLMVLLNLNTSNREIFEKIYNQYIFIPFVESMSSEVILDFLYYQSILYNMDECRNIEFRDRPYNLGYYKSFFKPGDTHILYDNIKDSEESNIYFVGTPGHLLSAIEAQNHFKTKNNILVILFFVVGDGKNINHMFKLSELFPYDKLVTYQHKSAKFYTSFVPFLKLLSEKRYNYLFIGFNTIVWRRMVANLSYKNLFYLDDGVHTITTHEDIYNEDAKKYTKKEYIPFPKTLNFQKVRLIYNWHGLKADTYLNNLNFFTVYNIKRIKNEIITKHNYAHIRSLFSIPEVKSDMVYILGQPLINIGFEQETYNDYLIYIFEYYHDKKVLFVPHRLEKIDNQIRNYIDESDSIDLLIPDESIELYFLNNHIYPNEVASFITSALFNIRKLFPDTVTKAFRIDTEFLDKSHQKNIELIYKYYQNEDVKIIEMRQDIR